MSITRGRESQWSIKDGRGREGKTLDNRTNFSSVSHYPHLIPFICSLITLDTQKHSSFHGTLWSDLNSSCQIREKLWIKRMGDKEIRPQLRYVPCLQDYWYVHTCWDNDTGRGRMPVFCQLRPNKQAGTKIQKAKSTQWLNVGGSLKSFLLMSSDKWEQQQKTAAPEPALGTLKSLSW